MPPTQQDVAERRPGYLAELARGTDRFHGPRRTDCPWCGSARLHTRLRTTDLVQRKPGTFVLDRCRDCAHVFQNPPLTDQGRDFYHRDLRGGIGPEAAVKLLGARDSARRHRAAALAMLPHGEPESWLDVGTGYAHFPAAAKDVHPYTAFDGLDTSAVVEDAVGLGRIEEGHRGTLTGLAPELAGRYDVLSMFHRLEQGPDPRAELAAARTVLRPGGHLLVESADPACRWAPLLGGWWLSWFQPQHLHLIPLDNLCSALRELGFEVVATGRREAHVPVDLAAALTLALGRGLPAPDAPWRVRPPSGLQRTARAAFSRAGAPFIGAARAADRLLAPLATRTGFANAYRVIARRAP
ncbi:class I SAM-dependent methyltransferase [Streptomyces sp. NPDC002004]